MPLLNRGSMVLVEVHSTLHPASSRINAQTNNYFKSFFSKEELDALFPAPTFLRLYCEDVEKQATQKQIEFNKDWINEVYHNIYGVTDKDEIFLAQSQYIDSNQMECYILAIYQKQ